MTDYELFFEKPKKEILNFINSNISLFLGKHIYEPEYNSFLKKLNLKNSGKISTFQFVNTYGDQFHICIQFSRDLGDGNNSANYYSLIITSNDLSICENLPQRNKGEYQITPMILFRFYCTKFFYSNLSLGDFDTVNNFLDKVKTNYLIYKDYIEDCLYLINSKEFVEISNKVLSCNVLEQYSDYVTCLDLLNSIATTDSLTGRRITLKEFFVIYAWKYDCHKAFRYTDCCKLINQMKKASIPNSNDFWNRVDTLVEERYNNFNKTKDLYVKIQKLFYKEILELKGFISTKYNIDPSWLGERKYDPVTETVIIPKNLPLDLSIPSRKNLKDRETLKGMLEIIEKLEKDLKNGKED